MLDKLNPAGATRATCSILDVETAVVDASRLSRALWLACRALRQDDECLPTDDDIAGIEELAWLVSKRCKAAEDAFNATQLQGLPS